MQKSYELCAIFSGALTPVEIEEQVKQVEALLAGAEVEILFKHSLGRRKLAYKIKNLTHADYRLWLFNADSKAVPALNQKLRLANFVVRHLIVNISEEIAQERITKIKEAKLGKPKEVKEDFRQATAEVAPIKTEPAKIETIEPIESVDKISRALPVSPMKETKKISLDDLDDKLEEILKRDTI